MSNESYIIITTDHLPILNRVSIALTKKNKRGDDRDVSLIFTGWPDDLWVIATDGYLCAAARIKAEHTIPDGESLILKRKGQWKAGKFKSKGEVSDWSIRIMRNAFLRERMLSRRVNPTTVCASAADVPHKTHDKIADRLNKLYPDGFSVTYEAEYLMLDDVATENPVYALTMAVR